MDTMKTKILPTRKSVRILVVTALFLAALTFTVMAVWNPFCNWIDDIKDRLNLNPGDVIENETGSFTSDQEVQEFSSIDEMEKTIGIHFDLLNNIPAQPSYINIAQHGNKKTIKLLYNTDVKQIVLTIYLKNAPYSQESMEQANLPKQTLGNLEWYVPAYANGYQSIVAFDNGYIYAITADSLDTIKTFMGEN